MEDVTATTVVPADGPKDKTRDDGSRIGLDGAGWIGEIF